MNRKNKRGSLPKEINKTPQTEEKSNTLKEPDKNKPKETAKDVSEFKIPVKNPETDFIPTKNENINPEEQKSAQGIQKSPNASAKNSPKKSTEEQKNEKEDQNKSPKIMNTQENNITTERVKFSPVTKHVEESVRVSEIFPVIVEKPDDKSVVHGVNNANQDNMDLDIGDDLDVEEKEDDANASKVHTIDINLKKGCIGNNTSIQNFTQLHLNNKESNHGERLYTDPINDPSPKDNNFLKETNGLEKLKEVSKEFESTLPRPNTQPENSAPKPNSLLSPLNPNPENLNYESPSNIRPSPEKISSENKNKEDCKIEPEKMPENAPLPSLPTLEPLKTEDFGESQRNNSQKMTIRMETLEKSTVLADNSKSNHQAEISTGIAGSSANAITLPNKDKSLILIKETEKIEQNNKSKEENKAPQPIPDNITELMQFEENNDVDISRSVRDVIFVLNICLELCNANSILWK